MSQDQGTSVLEVPLLGRDNSLASLEDGFMCPKAYELTFNPEVVQGLLLL
jgi:hypothetical protein